MVYRNIGGDGIGASCTLLEISGKKIIVDTGARLERIDSGNTAFGPIGGYLPDERIDLIVITHSHLDHIGTLPRWVREHPEAFLIITRQAFDTGKLMLWDGLKIARQIKFNNPQAEQVFSDLDLVQLLKLGDDRIKILEDAELPLIVDDPEFPDWVFGFHPAGHDPGAISIFIKPPTGPPIIVTGDVSTHNQEIVSGVLTPDQKFLDEVLGQNIRPILITEATNGGKVPPLSSPGLSVIDEANQSRQNMKRLFIDEILKVKKRGGQVLLPAFAKGRSANLALIMIEAGIVPHLDGMARKLFLLEVPNANELIAQGKVILIEDDETGKLHRRALWDGADPCGHDFSPIISPSANLDGGYGVEHAIHVMGRPENAVMFTGHIFTDSTSEKIVALEKGHTITLRSFSEKRGVIVNVRCDVQHFDFSAHDYRPALVERIRLLDPTHTIIHHCNGDSYNAMLRDITRLKIATSIYSGFNTGRIEIN